MIICYAVRKQVWCEEKERKMARNSVPPVPTTKPFFAPPWLHALSLPDRWHQVGRRSNSRVRKRHVATIAFRPPPPPSPFLQPCHTQANMAIWPAPPSFYWSVSPFVGCIVCPQHACLITPGAAGHSLCRMLSYPNSRHWFTTSFLQPLPYLVTPSGPENCQLTSSFSLVLKQ